MTPTPQPVVLAFPEPNTAELARAYSDLHLAANGTKEIKEQLGDPGLLPRPWDPPTCTRPALRRDLWRWLDDVVTWLNHEYSWDADAGMIPPCWPQHPHLVHEVAVLADQRRRASKDLTSNSLEEWHRYCLPAFYDRLKARAGRCGANEHQPWPADRRHTRDNDHEHRTAREARFKDDLALLTTPSRTEPPAAPARPQLTLVLEDGSRIDPVTGEVLPED